MILFVDLRSFIIFYLPAGSLATLRNKIHETEIQLIWSGLSCRWHYLINILHVDELIIPVCPNGQQILVAVQTTFSWSGWLPPQANLH